MYKHKFLAKDIEKYTFSYRNIFLFNFSKTFFNRIISDSHSHSADTKGEYSIVGFQ